MGERWTKEKAWAWYNSKPWIRGCNFIGSDCANRIDQWQEEGFEERLVTAEREMELARQTGFNSIRLIVEYDVWDQQHDGFLKRFERYIDAADRHGLTCCIVLANDCCVPKEQTKRTVFGQQHYDLGYHGGRKHSPHDLPTGDPTYSILDEPEIAENYLNMITELITIYRNDERVLMWNIFNEPGNRRGDLSLPIMERMFAAARAVDPIQPLTADLWSGIVVDGVPSTHIEQVALELSDVISFHGYFDFESFKKLVKGLKAVGRPMLCTEWLHRIMHNDIFDVFPYLMEEGIASFHWGLVASYKTQYFEPWERIWKEYKGTDWDLTKWQHDIYRPSLRPYDPREIELIRECCAKADQKFAETR